MKSLVAQIPLLDLFYPKTCSACTESLYSGEGLICLSCLLDMPYARMHDTEFNAIEARLHGRFDFAAATSLLYFVKNGRVQRMMHQLKYEGNDEVGRWMGAQLAEELLNSTRFSGIEYVVPVPLHPRKKRIRGYNQTDIISRGMEERGFHLFPDALTRNLDNSSQTRKNMTERWENVKGIFSSGDTKRLQGQKVLLLDDVMTTGATLEACAVELNRIPDIELYVATIACAEF